jgi:hypothetical protein
VAAPEKSLDLGNSYSCAGSIDVFSQFRDLVLGDILTDAYRQADRMTGPEVKRQSFTDTVWDLRTEQRVTGF